MATATTPTEAQKKHHLNPDAPHDVLRRHLKRMLPVELSRSELTDIAIAAAKKRQIVKQLQADLDAEKNRRKAHIDEVQRELDVQDRELASGQQERNVMCNEVYLDGQVLVARTDTWEVFERRAATAQEAQRFLPAVETTAVSGPPASLIDQARAAQAAAPDEAADDPDDEEPDDGLTELTPAQIAAKEAAAARRARQRKGKKS